MNRYFIVGLLSLLLLGGVSAYIVDPASTGFGSQNRTQNIQNMTGNWLRNNATFIVSGYGGAQFLAVPWYDTGDSTFMTNTGGSNDLHNCVSSSYTPPYSNESFCVVTDEFSRAAYSLLFATKNDTIASATINTIKAMNDTGNTYGSRSGSNLTEWTTYWNYNSTLGYWTIRKDQVSDSAADADAYNILILALINNTPDFNSTNRVNAGAYLSGMCTVFAANNFYDANSLNLVNRVNPSQTVRYFPCGGSNVCSNLRNGDLAYQAYFGPMMEALAACRKVNGDTGAYNYSKIAEDSFQTHLMSANWTGTTFSLGPGRAYNWSNVSSGQVPNAYCTNSCTNGGQPLGTEWPDSLRAVNMCRAAWVWQNYTGRSLENASTYCGQWASKSCVTSTSYGYGMYQNGTVYSGCSDTGFRAVGLGMSLFFLYNNSGFTNMISQYNSHYGTCSGGLCEMDSQNAFGVYDKSFGLTDIPYAIGLADWIFNGSYAASNGSGGGSSGGGAAVSGNINITLNSPLNATTTTSSTVVLNVTVWNLNTTNGSTTTNGTLPQTLYNTSFSANPTGDGWTLGGWSYDSGSQLIIYNGSDFGSAAYTQNLSLSQYDNGYRITINQSVGNITNAKIYFGTTSGSSTGDRVLIERTGSGGSTYNVKHDGGNYSSFTVNVNQYLELNITVNKTGGWVNVSRGTSSWKEGIVNSHAYNDSIGFVPGSEMTNTWNISNLLVQNIGNPTNSTSYTYEDPAMNVSFYWSNNTLIYTKTNVSNATSVNYTVVNLAAATYNWYATARSASKVANLTGLTFNVTGAASSVGNITIILNGPSNNSIVNTTSALLNVTIRNNDTSQLMNVTFLTGGSFPLSTTTDVTDFETATYNYTGLSDGSYDWYVRVQVGVNYTYLYNLHFTVFIPSSNDTAPVLFNFYNEITGDLLNTTTVYLEYFNDNTSSTHSTTDGMINTSIESPASYFLRYYASGFNTRQYQLTLTGTGNQTVNLYLLNDTLGSNVTAYVYDQISQPVEGATIKVLKYDVFTNSYVLNQVVDTNFEGRNVIDVQTNSEYYRFIIVYNGAVVLYTEPTYIFGNSILLRINTGANDLSSYFSQTGVAGNITYNSNTQTASFLYTDQDNIISTGCLQVYQVINGQRVYYNQSCANYSSAVITVPVPGNDSSYYLVGGVTKSGQEQTIQTYVINGIEALPQQSTNAGLWILIMLICVCAFIATFSIQLSVVMAGLAVLLCSVTGIVLISIPVATMVLLLCIAMAFLLR